MNQLPWGPWPLLLPAVVFVGGCSARSADPRLDRDDRRTHAAVGFAIGAGTRCALDYLPATRDWPAWGKTITAAAAGAAVGLAKEAWDQVDHGQPDAGDANATAYGSAAGALAIHLAWEF